MIEVEADGVGFKIDGKQLVLQGFRNTDNPEEKNYTFAESFDKNIETPDIVLKKYGRNEKQISFIHFFLYLAIIP